MALIKVTKWGNSLGVRLPKNVLDNANIKVNDEVQIEYKQNMITITKQEKELTIKELFAGYQPDLNPEKEIDYGTPVGEEVW